MLDRPIDDLVIRPLDDVGSVRWDAFVDACCEGSFFHLSGWRTVIERSFGHRTHYLCAERDGRIAGVLPLTEIRSFLFGHAIISSGYGVCGGPAVAEDAARRALDAEAEELLKACDADYLEYRCPQALRQTWVTRNNLYAGFTAPLPRDEEDNLKQIPRKQRAVVRKAIGSRLTWKIENAIDTFYRLYAISVRNLGTPVFTKVYFASLLEQFPDCCDVLTVADEGTPVASVLSFYFKGTVLPFYTGSIPEARRLGANDLMYWRLMRHAVAKGCTKFDFGRSKVGTGPYGFKRNWGFEPQPLVHQFLTRPGIDMPNVNPTNPKYRLMIEAWKRLPLSVSMMLGPIIARQIG